MRIFPALAFISIPIFPAMAGEIIFMSNTRTGRTADFNISSDTKIWVAGWTCTNGLAGPPTPRIILLNADNDGYVDEVASGRAVGKKQMTVTGHFRFDRIQYNCTVVASKFP